MFNDFIMVFVSIALYFITSYIKDKKQYKILIVGFICFLLPYMRQQGIVISSMLILMPMVLFYLDSIDKNNYKVMINTLLRTFIITNILFITFIILRNGLDGIEILFSSMTSLVDMAQPAIGYDNKVTQIANYIFNYTSDGMDWHGYFMRFLSYWFIVIIPAIYFIHRLISKKISNGSIKQEDIIKFIVSVIVLSTIVFNYPVNEDARLKVQFGIGIWLFVEALILTFYKKNTKILSIISIAIIFLLIHHLKINQFIEQFKQNYTAMKETKINYEKMPRDTPYASMKFKADYANHINNIIYKLREYQSYNKDKGIIFDGEIVEINNFIFLTFATNKVLLQHKFPYHYSVFDRDKFYPKIKEDFRAFIDKNKPIVIGCSSTPPLNNYKILININETCNIYIPK